MRAKIRPILAECIENGIWAGMEAARKHTLGEEPYDADLIDDIEYWIWQMIDERFDFEKPEVQTKASSSLGHYCPDWDFLWVGENDPEMTCCTCNLGDNLVENPKEPSDVVNDGMKPS